ncbi:MAG: glycosyl transferase [Sphingomonadales bacterium]|nr:MAG: glycosyl transferase [Sphingomonadales bacterium]
MDGRYRRAARQGGQELPAFAGPIAVDAGGPDESRERLNWVDAARGIGIVLVVIAHVWTRGPVRDAIYAFHMPLFFLLSGYVARPRPLAAFARTQFWAMAVPYVAFLLTLALTDQLIEHMRGHLPMFRSWGQAAWALLLGGSELRGPFTIFWFIPCLAIARLCQNALWRLWPDVRDWRWIVTMAATAAFGLWGGARTDFSPLGLLSVPVALPLLWLGALWRSLKDDRLLVAGALLVGATIVALTVPEPLNMKVGDYGGLPLLSLLLAVLLSLATAAVARLSCCAPPLRFCTVVLGRRSLIIMYCHVAVIHYSAPYIGKPGLLVLAILLPLAIHKLLTCTEWGRRYFLGEGPQARKNSYNNRVER